MTDSEKNLRDLLAYRFYRPLECNQILQDLNIESLSPMNIIQDSTALEFWNQVVNIASFGCNLKPLIHGALKKLPNDQALLLAAQDIEFLSEKRGPQIDPPTQIETSSLEALTDAIGTLLPISFLRRGVDCARSVGCVFYGERPFGTGWLISDNWLITNNHVLKDEVAAAACNVRFDYESDDRGLPIEVKRFDLAPGNGGFHTSPVAGNDWSAVKVAGDANALYGSLSLATRTAAKNDFVNIIQHPQGRRKEIALYHNTVTEVGNARLRYLTDTEPGSSGSPVFNSDWEVVALHHASVQLPDRQTGKPYTVNEGIPVNTLREDLQRAGVL